VIFEQLNYLFFNLNMNSESLSYQVERYHTIMI